MGFYMTPAINREDRLPSANNFPILLGPHGSDFNDVTAALECLLHLDKGVMVTVNGQPALISVFTLSFLGDIPQQDKNAGTRGPMGLKLCRFCFMDETHQIEKMDVIKDW